MCTENHDSKIMLQLSKLILVMTVIPGSIALFTFGLEYLGSRSSLGEISNSSGFMVGSSLASNVSASFPPTSAELN